ncbi:hypothetical protein MVEN_00345700 [Mycena venus]|uniref:Alcohol dehydrogenase-like C-terminal domain-containing protein n=1 Tax=Mycena venus TaxID=2733690 RepID=A0A8H6YP89_9AGAR|nr:hypothetical protein MVEN_00345700 [Mycena venus]
MSVEFTVFKGSSNGDIVEYKTLHNRPTGNQVLVKSLTLESAAPTRTINMPTWFSGTKVSGLSSRSGTESRSSRSATSWDEDTPTKLVESASNAYLDQYCPNREYYGDANFHQGSFSLHAIWDASFLFKVPDGLAPQHAAPLMCGGATVFEVIESYNIRPTERVGVVVIGGLGHLAIQFLAKMGVVVVVFSSTEFKREEALGLGATEFYATKGTTTFNMAKLDHLLVTTNNLLDWKPYATVHLLSYCPK